MIQAYIFPLIIGAPGSAGIVVGQVRWLDSVEEGDKLQVEILEKVNQAGG